MLRVVFLLIFLGGSKLGIEYKVTQRKESIHLLYNLQKYFDCGTVVIDNRKTETYKYHVTSISVFFEKVFPHFEKYPLITSKQLNYLDFCKIRNLYCNNEKHQINNILKNMNRKRSFEDKYYFLKDRILTLNPY
jgi:hypothetical protein